MVYVWNAHNVEDRPDFWIELRQSVCCVVCHALNCVLAGGSIATLTGQAVGRAARTKTSVVSKPGLRSRLTACKAERSFAEGPRRLTSAMKFTEWRASALFRVQ